MKIISLKLENFQGIRQLELNLDGKNASIYGDNATGKTTIANAWSWLLFGKPASDIKNFSPKTKDGLGDIHHLINSVEARIELDDMSIVTLKKVHKEKWVKKRGSETEEMTGEGDEYFIDGVPKKQKEYDSYVENITANSDIVKMLTTVNYFPEVMKWDKRRSLLLEICGNITDDEIISHTLQLQPLDELLIKPGTTDQKYSVDELLKIKKSSISKINKELDQLPALINEAKKAIPDVRGLSESKLKKSREDINVKIQQLHTEISDLQSTSPEHEYQRQYKALESKMAEAELLFKKTLNAQHEPILNDLNKAKTSLNDVESKISGVQRTIKTSEQDFEYMKQSSARLKKELEEVRSTSFSDDAQYCPTCHQKLPEDQIEKLRNEFNLNKSKKIEEIQARGKQNYSMSAFTELERFINSKKTELEKLEKEKLVLGCKIQELEAEQNALVFKRFESTSEFQAFQERFTALKEQFNDGSRTSLELQVNGRKSQIEKLNKDLDEINTMISQIQLADKQNLRVAELTKNQKTLSEEYSRDEQTVYLCEQFVMVKTKMVTAVINNHFRSIKFKLFDKQMNGGIKECCDVMIPSPEGALVPYQFANSAGKLNAGLEIIETLSKHYDLNLPLFIDNAESVTKLNSIDNQTVRLVVSDTDEKLRIELD